MAGRGGISGTVSVVCGSFFFFFQAEDGIRDIGVTGVQTCALPIFKLLLEVAHMDELNTVVVVTHDIRSALIVSDTLFMLGRDRTPDGKITSGARIDRKSVV